MKISIVVDRIIGMMPAMVLYPRIQFPVRGLLRKMVGKLDFIHPLIGTRPPKKIRLHIKYGVTIARHTEQKRMIRDLLSVLIMYQMK